MITENRENEQICKEGLQPENNKREYNGDFESY